VNPNALSVRERLDIDEPILARIIHDRLRRLSATGVRSERWPRVSKRELSIKAQMGASPSSRFLVSTKNLCRGQRVPDLGHRFLSQSSLAQVVARVSAG
jgi:hypothetical protein